MRIQDRLIINSLVKNLNEEEVKSLYSQGNSLKKIIVLDYLNLPKGKLERTSLERALLDRGIEDKQNANTPQFEITKCICEDEIGCSFIKQKIDQVHSIDELKKYICLDYLLTELGEERKNKINFSLE
jgi:hypothetical protein